jgi:hypothetical protein
MDSEAKIILAFLFNRSGKTKLKESELYLPLSMELGWLSTKESQEFVKYALKQELLVKKEGQVYPNFSVEKITIPIGFTPSKRLFSETISQQKTEHVLDLIAMEIGKKTNRKQVEILDEILQEGQEKKLLPEVAALSVARKYNLDVVEWYDLVETILLRGNTE